MDPDYKARKEAFVSNLAGSDIQDINLVTLVAPVLSPLQSSMLSVLIKLSFIGFRPSLVRSPIALVLLLPIRSCRIVDRFPAQRTGHFVRDYCLFLCTTFIEHLPDYTGRPIIPHPTTRALPAEGQTAPQTK